MLSYEGILQMLKKGTKIDSIDSRNRNVLMHASVSNDGLFFRKILTQCVEKDKEKRRQSSYRPLVRFGVSLLCILTTVLVQSYY